MSETWRWVRTALTAWALAVLAGGCNREGSAPGSAEPGERAEPQTSLLLVTLDTTRADRVEMSPAATPHLTALADRGLRFTQAYSVVPTTLPAHTSMLTGLYPADHGIRENGRRVNAELPLLSEQLGELGYTTAAFVSGFPLDSRFGLARGFDHYDDQFGGDRVERSAGETTDRVLDFLGIGSKSSCDDNRACPLFLWVHYFDPHEPYSPPEPFATRFEDDPYLGEIAYMDQELGRLIGGFETEMAGRPWRIVVVGDHGEGLGDHGEALHGNLLYQGVMRVPLVVAGTDVAPGVIDRAVGVRDLHDTLFGWAGGDREAGILADSGEPVLGEALKPYLQYGWQPQFMAVYGGVKVIRAGETEIYDVGSDPEERENLAGGFDLDPLLSRAIAEYETRALAEPQGAPAEPSAETRDKLASLGYIAAAGRPSLRADAPSPKDMVHLYRDLDVGAGLFIRGEYERAIPVFTRVLEADPHNLMVALRLAVAHSVTGDSQQALTYFERARSIDPSSVDLHHYQAMHYMREGRWELAEPLFESVLAVTPERQPALEGLAEIYTRQGRFEEAERLVEKLVHLEGSPGLELARLGELRMARGDTAGAIRAFERSREILGDAFTYHLELGVLYLANQQLLASAQSLDRVSAAHPGYPMALFKRAQVSVLLEEPDREDRVRLAWERADEATRPLIEQEELFREIRFR